MYEFYAGCDTHKEKHFISIINSKGEVQKSFEIENSLEGWKKALDETSEYSSLIWGIENSANFAKNFCRFLLKSRQVIKEINPVFTGKSRKASTRRNKTDLVDSIVIAKTLRDERVYLPDIQVNDKQADLKVIIRQREELIKEQTRIKNRLHSKLTDFDTQYKKIYGDINRKKTLNRLESTLESKSDILSGIILQDIRLLRNLISEISLLDEILAKKQKENALIDNLATLTGVNTVNACKLVSLIGDIDRFKSPDHLTSFAGISPIEKSSGKSSKKYRNIGGNRQLNNVFYLIALTQIRFNLVAKEYYEKKINSDGKTKKQALHCLMRRLVKIIWMMYKHNQPYSYEKQPNAQLLQAA